MKKVGQALLNFALYFGLALLLFTVLRLLFFLFNFNHFPDPHLINFLGGIRFDWITITLLYAPFLLLFPFFNKRKSRLLKFLFLLSSALAIAFNVIDFEYFKFTEKRTTSDLFTTSGIGNDFQNLVFTFALDFWYLVLLAIGLFALVAYAYNLLRKRPAPKLNSGQFAVYFLMLLIFYGLGARGGLQYKPLNVVQASQYAVGRNMAIVLNTPFTIMKSAYNNDLALKHYFPEGELEQIYTPVQYYSADSTAPRLNVVLIIAESFSREYIGALNSNAGYTPFLDSLIGQSLIFSNGFANGKKSIEGLPAILSGIPTLMNESFISSKYAANRIESIATLLNQKGYSSTFYHGGENGTMGFEAYSKMAGIPRYIGRNEYPDPSDYDGNWGIFDEPFLQFCLNDMSDQQKPFFSAIFTLSSHHPFTVPTKYENRFEAGPLPILKSIRYADYALSRFFKEARKEPWFDETVFILTADHTSESFTPAYQNAVGNYRIPILFYAPKYIAAQERKDIAQQDDIFPSVINLLGIGGKVIAFGTSVFSEQHDPFAVSYINNYYQLIRGPYCLQFDGEKTLAFYNYVEDPELKLNLADSASAELVDAENKLKAIIQQYNNRLITNKLTPN